VGSLRKTGLWLGLAEDSDDEFDEDADDYPVERGSSWSRRHPAADALTSRRSHPAGKSRAADSSRAVVSSREEEDEGYQIATIHASGFRDARTIGEYYRQDIPVVIDVSALEDPDARRIVDFAAGLIFGRRGNIHRLARGVFLLSPLGTSILTGDRSQHTDGDFFDQS
jgi:cell division inhibitor SepF